MSPTKLFNKDFVLLWQGQFISRLGGNVYGIAMVLWLKEVTGSATIVGLVLMLGSLPSLLLSGIGGTFADRASRKHIIIWSDVMRGLLVLSFAALLVAWPEREQLTTVWVVTVTLLMASTTAFFIPAVAASVPDIVPSDELVKANSLRQLTAQIALVAGQAAGGTLFRIVGAPIIVAINGISFLVSALAACFVNIPRTQQTPVAASRSSFGGDFVEGLRFVWRADGLRRLLLFSAIFTFFTVPIIVLMPFYVEDFLGAAPDWYGWLMATYAGGTALGAVLTAVSRVEGVLRARMMIAFAILSSVAVGILGFIQEIDVALVLALLLGAMTGFNGINITSITQARVSGEMRGRVQGLLATVAGSLAPIGMGLGGVVYDLVDGNITLIFGSCGLIMAVLSIVVANNSAFREFISYSQPRPSDSEAEQERTMLNQSSS